MEDTMVDHVVILAGGSGTRLWPASVKGRPKQFMPAQGELSFLRQTLDRAFALGIPGKVVIVAHKDHAPGIRREFDQLPAEKQERLVLLSEPEARNTAPALTAAVLWAREEGSPAADSPEDQTVLVLPSDHLVSPQEAFRKDVEQADRLARKDYLVPFGIPPVRPETGYGYIQAGDPVEPGRLVKKFKEKPDRKTAEAFLAAGDHYWNSGMFVYGVGTFLREMEACTPEVVRALEGVRFQGMLEKSGGLTALRDPEELAEMYSRAPATSVDYALMEKSSRVAMVGTSFQWNDVGSWDEMAELPPPEGQAVYQDGSRGCYVNADMPVALCGVEDLMVVVQNGAVLVCRKGEGQRVKAIVNQLKEDDRQDLL